MDGLVEHLSTLLNNFDIYYENSDSQIIFDKGEKSKLLIERKLSNLEPFQIQKLKKALNKVGHLAYLRYFTKSKL